MNRRKALAMIAATPLAWPVSQAAAGGMAVVYLLGDVTEISAGSPARIRFAVLGHDMPAHLWNGFDSEITLIPKTGGDTITFPVSGMNRDAMNVGIYSTEIVVETPGVYKWFIRPGSWEPTYFPSLIVSEPMVFEATPVSEEVTVVMNMSGFSPAVVEIPAGTTVRWRNSDPGSAHQITWENLGMDDSSPIPYGCEYSHTFQDRGEFAYFCSPHPSMTGIIRVTD